MSFEVAINALRKPFAAAAVMILLILSVVVASPAHALTASTLTLTGPTTAWIWSSGEEVHVTGDSPTGTVQFQRDGVNFGDPVEVDSQGNAAPPLDYDYDDIGQTRTITAIYSGDSNNAGSTSNSLDVYFYSQPYAYGYTYENGSAVGGVTVEAFDAPYTSSSSPIFTTTSDGEYGSYTFNLQGSIDTPSDAAKTYVLRATYPDGTIVYYSDSNYGAPDVTDPSDATARGPLTWGNTAYAFYHTAITAPVWTDSTIADPTQGVSYSDGVSASGDGVTYSVVGGTLPLGLSLDPDTGDITGTPIGSGPYDFTVRASNSAGDVDLELTGTIGEQAPAWTDSTIADPAQGVSYSDGVSAPGPGILYLVISGTLPDGLWLDSSTGAITGTPTGYGAYEFTVRASNSGGHVDTELTGTIAQAPPLWTDSAILPPAQGAVYSDAVAASGSDVSYSIVAGGLPAGITLDPSSGVISGTASGFGPYSATVRASNGGGHVDATLSGTVTQLPTSIVVTPSFAKNDRAAGAGVSVSGQGLTPGSEYTVTLHSTPVVLTSGVTSATGTLSTGAQLPSSVPAGIHRVIVSAIAADGSTVEKTLWISVDSAGMIAAVSDTEIAPALAMTGSSNVASELLAGLVILSLGIAARTASRRRVRS